MKNYSFYYIENIDTHTTTTRTINRHKAYSLFNKAKEVCNCRLLCQDEFGTTVVRG